MSAAAVIVEPMPDELFRCHEYRRARVVGARDVASQYRDLLAARTTMHLSGRKVAAMTLLAEAAQMSPQTYAAKHTMLPSLRVTEYEMSDETIARMGWVVQAFHHAATLPCGQAQICVQCVMRDRQTKFFSWFRRSHQHAAIVRCPQDGDLLRRVLSDAPFSQLPHQWIEQGLIEQVTEDAPSDQNPEWFKRYVDITIALSNRTVPIPSRRLNRHLASIASRRGYRTKPTGSQPLLSAALAETAGRKWISRYVPSLRDASVGSWNSTIDGLDISLEFSRPGHVYAMILAFLTSSKEKANAALERCRVDFPLLHRS